MTKKGCKHEATVNLRMLEPMFLNNLSIYKLFDMNNVSIESVFVTFGDFFYCQGETVLEKYQSLLSKWLVPSALNKFN